MNKAKSPKVAGSNRSWQAKSMGHLNFADHVQLQFRYKQKNAY